MKPARLGKQSEELGVMETFCQKYAHIIVFFLIILILILVAAVVIACIDMANAGNMTMVESGNYYNHLKDVI